MRAGVARRPLELPRGTWLAGYPNPFRAHRSVRELIELVTHLAFYAGWPSAMSAVTVARELFEHAGDPA